MKYVAERIFGPLNLPVVELTRGNLEVLLAKLDDPNSHAALVDPDWSIAVVAVENDAHSKGAHREIHPAMQVAS